ncbi:putative DNA-directed DNA polymerase [Candidatus Desulfosporosinus infrequens]|uniref:Putative DNA-directed DNA polymerase n=1 Tax=Candidatus Desulfosporosinus infrequens TaxID=2043169 RepID=A0A2U3LQ73_9FIRM|nr:putative DNA-directed DNA polymerase [Candidatus Desulfosporosinus infrequens]
MTEMRTILHSDLNSFYASVEMMLDPSLRGKAVAICGSTEDRHGIVLAKSELAKKAGVKTGMVNWEASHKLRVHELCAHSIRRSSTQ